MQLLRSTLAWNVAVLSLLAGVPAGAQVKPEAVPEARPEVRVESQVVGPAWEQGTTYTISPKGLHLATVCAKGSRFVVVIDGVEGEKFDQILNAAGEVNVQYFDTGFVMNQGFKWQGPVAFSPDGTRYAYAARLSKEIIVILDGKEIYRAPFSQVAAPVSLLSFTPDGKHLFFYTQTMDTFQSFQLMMDGKPATPPFNATPYPRFSEDGTRWMLVGTSVGENPAPMLIIDGKKAGYTGSRPQFTPDGKHVVCTAEGPNGQSLLVDGKAIMSASNIDRFRVSSKGDVGAIAFGADGKKKLYINGKPAPGGEDAWDVVWSPDGAHWAANCMSPPSAWVVVDGKKQQEYMTVSDVNFSPDSSKCVYIAAAGVKKFVVCNGEEDTGNGLVHIKPIFGNKGNHFAYCAGDSIGTLKVYHDGKVLPKTYNVFNLAVSADGDHYAYYGAIDALSSQLIVDGEVKGGGAAFGDQILFSPNGKHVAAMGSPPKGSRSVFLNSIFLPTKDLAYSQIVAFTPDSQHLLLKGNEADKAGNAVEGWYLDGERVAQFAMRGVTWAGNNRPQNWETQPDGSVLLLGMEPNGQAYGVMKRVRVPAGSTGGVEAWIERVKAEAKAAEEAKAAAKKKAEDDAAKAKADAEAAKKKAADDLAAKKAKAAEDAAKKKAEAEEAKRKAQEEAAKKAAAKKKGPG